MEATCPEQCMKCVNRVNLYSFNWCSKNIERNYHTCRISLAILQKRFGKKKGRATWEGDAMSGSGYGHKLTDENYFSEVGDIKEPNKFWKCTNCGATVQMERKNYNKRGGITTEQPTSCRVCRNRSFVIHTESRRFTTLCITARMSTFPMDVVKGVCGKRGRWFKEKETKYNGV